MNFETRLASLRRFHVVDAHLWLAAVRAQTVGLKFFRDFVSHVAMPIAAYADDETLSIDRGLNASINVAGVIFHKSPLTNGRPYGRMKLNFFGWNEAFCLCDAFAASSHPEKLALNANIKGNNREGNHYHMANERPLNRRVQAQHYSDNPAFQEKLKATMAAIVPDNFTRLDISFPPYWKAELASGFYAQVLGREPARNEKDFDRWLWRNAGPNIDCRRGAVANGEIETVGRGRIFTTGAFAGLKLENYIGYNLAVICAGQDELPATEETKGALRKFWQFEVYVDPETLLLINSQRESDVTLRMQAATLARRDMILEMERINARSYAALQAGQKKAPILTEGVAAE